MRKKEAMGQPTDLTSEANFLWREGHNAFWYRLPNGMVLSAIWTPTAHRRGYMDSGSMSDIMTWFESEAIERRMQQDASEEPVFMSLDEVADIVKHSAEDSVEVWAWDTDDSHPFDEPAGWQSSEDVMQIVQALSSGNYEELP